MTLMVLLSGCFYPQEKKVQNQVPTEQQIQMVQSAVDQYQKDNDGLLPIKTKEKDTDLYIKYPIEFKKLIPEYLSEPPGNAFENGGIFQYVLIDVEKNPTVKIFDLRIAEEIRGIQLRLHSKDGYPPFKEQIAPNVYTLDFEKIGYKKDPQIVSPYTNNNLPLIISGDGNIYVDYSSDLYEAMKKHDHSFQKGEYIRPILTKDSHFVPAYSLPYTTTENNEPAFMAK